MAELLAAEFERAEQLVAAARSLERRSELVLDALTPYPVPELATLLKLRRSPVPLLALVAGLGGAGLAYVGQWYLTAVLYPLNVGGRPLHSAPAFVPISFELGILSAVLATLVTFFLAARLGRLWRIEDEIPGMGSSSLDRFWLTVRSPPDTGLEGIEQLLRTQGAIRIERVEGG